MLPFLKGSALSSQMQKNTTLESDLMMPPHTTASKVPVEDRCESRITRGKKAQVVSCGFMAAFRSLLGLMMSKEEIDRRKEPLGSHGAKEFVALRD